MMDDSLAQRAHTCLVAGALGDAWVQRAGAGAGQQPLFPSRPSLSAETWLTLATCEAMARAGGRVRASQVAAVFREWGDRARIRANGPDALRGMTADADALAMHVSGDDAVGLVVRATPLAFVLDPSRDDDREVLFAVTRLTHDSDEACAAALAGVVAVRCCLHLDRAPADLLARVAGALPESHVRERLFEADHGGGSAATVDDRADEPGTLADAVVRSLIIATRYPDGDLEGAFGEAGLLGTEGRGIAALSGQIIGAAGADIPRAWLERLPERSEVESVLERFAQAVAALPAW
jgi:ADP-ribosylglycohydrolase